MPIAAGIYYHEHGDNVERPPLVLIHGAGGQGLVWPPQIRRLPNQRVYALDLPGHGFSHGFGFQQLEQYLDPILKWMQAIPISQAHFCGHSMGAGIVLNLAIHLPEIVDKMILIGAGAKLHVHPALLKYASQETTYQRAVEMLVARSFGRSSLPRSRELITQRLLASRWSILFNDLTACADFDVTQHLAEIRTPALILTGSEDQMTPPRIAGCLEKILPEAHLEIISGAGHMLPLERMEQVIQLIKDFLVD